jgi:hypothetical protein
MGEKRNVYRLLVGSDHWEDREKKGGGRKIQ